MEPIVRAICQKESLPCQRIQPLSGGQVNAVFLVDGKHVIRIGAREDAGQRLERESLLLQSLAGKIPVARVLAFGQEQGFYYQVQQYMPGQKLYLIWKDLAAAEQDAIAAQLAASLKVLHSASFPDYSDGRPDSPRYATWQDFLAAKFTRAAAELRELKIHLVPGFLEMAERYFDEHQHVLQGGAPTLVHSDLTMVNILAENGKKPREVPIPLKAPHPAVSAILDFEFAMQAPADYELLAIEAFCLYPNDWAEEENEAFCTADFASFIPLLRKHYPELFAIPHLRERLNLYHVYAALSSYLEWRKANLSTIPPERMAAQGFYMGRFWNILYDNGARMFYG